MPFELFFYTSGTFQLINSLSVPTNALMTWNINFKLMTRNWVAVFENGPDEY
jgi:hypothetical protein